MRQTLKILVATSALLIGSQLAHAANSVPFPAMADPEAACRDLSPTPSTGYNVCLSLNQEGYDNARAVWDQLSQSSAEFCAEYTPKIKPFDQYDALGACAMARFNLDRMQEIMSGVPKSFKW
jgi:hypothetical protein